VDALDLVESNNSDLSLDHIAINEANPDLYRRERLAR
jgi:hypothetical protein